MKTIDVHCHLDQYKDHEVKKMLSEAKIDIVVGAAMNKASGERLLDLKGKHSNIKICLGIHPEYPQYYQEFESVKEQILSNRHKISAIGEIGLPYYSLEAMEKQEKIAALNNGKLLLTKFLDLAANLELPVVLHAIQDTASYAYEALQEKKITQALFHWFEGDQDTLIKIVDAGYYISVSPEVLNDNGYAEFVSHIPLDNMVLESDGPWHYNGRIGVPAMILEIAEYLSKKRNMKKKEILEIIYKNTCILYQEIL